MDGGMDGWMSDVDEREKVRVKVADERVKVAGERVKVRVKVADGSGSWKSRRGTLHIEDEIRENSYT